MSVYSEIEKYLIENDIKIVAIDYIYKKGFMLTDQNGVIHDNQKIPFLMKAQETDLLKLEKEHSVKTQENSDVLEKAHKEKEELANIVNRFISKIVELKLGSKRSLGSGEVQNLLNSVDNINIRQKLLSSVENILEFGYVDALSGCFSPTAYQHFFSANEQQMRREGDLEEFQLMLDTLNEAQSDSVMFIDLNNFKMINDLDSHQSGDLCIQKLGAFLLKETSLVSIRRSGDEFIVFGQKEKLTELKKTFNDELFLSHLNSHVTKETMFNDKPIGTSVSAGISSISVPKRTSNILEALNAKSVLNDYIDAAEREMRKEKEVFQKANGAFRSTTDRINHFVQNDANDYL
jgi:diguanylate cyclase (GGDEF)-like protein